MQSPRIASEMGDKSAELVHFSDLALLEVDGGIRVHRRGLHEGLELIARMGRCSFEANNPLDGLLAEDGRCTRETPWSSSGEASC